jgi:hypothetical protein
MAPGRLHWFWLSFLKESQMPKLPRDPHKLIFKYGLAAVLLVELYRFLRFIAS